MILLLLYASCTWYEVRLGVFDCCVGRVNVVVVRFPAAGRQPHAHTTYTVATGTKARA